MKLKLLTLLATSLFAVSAQSAVIGQYLSYSKSEFDRDRPYSNGLLGAVQANSNGLPSRGIPKNPIICVDGRQVPGVVAWDGNCYVEYNGKSWRNSSYSILKHSSSNPGTIFTWKWIGKDYRMTGNEVTAGGRDSGDYTYHCVVNKFHESRGYVADLIGKYVPNHDRCYLPDGTGSRDRTHVDITNSKGAYILVQQ